MTKMSHGGGSVNIVRSASYNENYVRFTVHNIPFDVTRRYTAPVKVIGKGASGFVISMKDSQTGEEVAVKKVPRAFLNPRHSRAVLREIRLLRHLEHPHIIGLREVIRPPRLADFQDVLLVTDKMDFDLHSVIRSQQELTDDHCQHFVYQILCGLKYMHSANVIHRDLKPSNLLVDLDCTLKICDFGLARRMSERDAMTQEVVTLSYRAPELLLRCQEYTKAIDIWSVGCILMEILSRRILFTGRNEAEQLRLILELLGSPTEADLTFLPPEAEYFRQGLMSRPCHRQRFADVFKGINPVALDLAERMLFFNPDRRISVEDALAHPYLSSRHDVDFEPTCDNMFDFHEYEQGHLASVPYYQAQIWEESVLINERERESNEMRE